MGDSIHGFVTGIGLCCCGGSLNCPVKLSLYLRLTLEVHRTGGLEEVIMSRLEVHEDRTEPTSVLVSFDLCEEVGLEETGALCHRA